MLNMLASAGARSLFHFKQSRPSGADDQTHAADGAEHHRRAKIGIRRLPTEKVIVESCDGRGGQVEKKTIRKPNGATTFLKREKLSPG